MLVFVFSVVLLTISSSARSQDASETDLWVELWGTPPQGAGPSAMDDIWGATSEFGDTQSLSVVIYAITQWGWFVQPYTAAPFTSISADFEWSARSHLGDWYAVLLVDASTYDVSATDSLSVCQKDACLQQLLQRDDVYATDWKDPDYRRLTTTVLPQSTRFPMTTRTPASTRQLNWIQIWTTPPFGQGSTTRGAIRGITNDFGDYNALSVVIYSVTEWGWFVQPSAMAPFTSVNADFEWSSEIYLGWFYAVLLVDASTYDVAATDNVSGEMDDCLQQLMQRDDVYATDWKNPDYRRSTTALPQTTPFPVTTHLLTSSTRKPRTTGVPTSSRKPLSTRILTSTHKSQTTRLPQTSVVSTGSNTPTGLPQLYWIKLWGTPPFGQGSTTRGIIWGITNDFGDSNTLSVVIYSVTEWGWFVQPSAMAPFTSVNADFEWSAEIYLGWFYAVLLVDPSTYDVDAPQYLGVCQMDACLQQLLQRDDVYATDWKDPDYRRSTTMLPTTTRVPITTLLQTSSGKPTTTKSLTTRTPTGTRKPTSTGMPTGTPKPTSTSTISTRSISSSEVQLPTTTSTHGKHGGANAASDVWWIAAGSIVLVLALCGGGYCLYRRNDLFLMNQLRYERQRDDEILPRYEQEGVADVTGVEPVQFASIA